MAINASLVAGAIALGLLLLIRLVMGRTRGRQTRPRGDIFPSTDAGMDAPSADQVLFDSAKRLLDAHISSNDVLDGRVSAALSVGSTVLPVTIGLLNVLDDGEALPLWTERFIQYALAAYGLLLVSSLVAFATRKLDFRPNIETLQRYATQGLDGVTLRRWVAEEYILSIEANRTRLLWKGRAVGRRRCRAHGRNAPSCLCSILYRAVGEGGRRGGDGMRSVPPEPPGERTITSGGPGGGIGF